MILTDTVRLEVKFMKRFFRATTVMTSLCINTVSLESLLIEHERRGRNEG